MKNTAVRESALARDRLSHLKTNRRLVAVRRKTGVEEIKTTLRERWSEILSRGWNSHDFLAGLTVATVAMPLNVALAIAAGLPASAGLIAGAVGGLVAAAFGGSNYQVSGPAAALNVLVFGIVAQFGPGGAALAAVLCGVANLGAGLLGHGKLSNFIPKVVLAGFTTGVGLKLLDQQVPILLGLNLPLAQIFQDFFALDWLRGVSWLSVVCGIFVAWMTVGLAQLKSFPSSLLGILIVAFVAYELDWNITRVGEIDLNSIAWAWPELREGTNAWALLLAALPLMFLSGIESLLSAKAVDELSGGKSGYSANTELFGQGLGNIAVGFAGGMPITGVIVRSSVNQQAGAVTRMSAIFHSLILAASAYYLGKWIGVIPVAALAGLLIVIAYRLIKVKLLVEAMRKNVMHAAAFITAALGTVSGHLMLGLSLACFLVFLDYKAKQRQDAKRTTVVRPSSEIRAVVTPAGSPLEDSDTEATLRDQVVWHRQIRTKPKVHPTAFVHSTASVIGWVEVGREVNIAADTSLRADEGAPFFIGDRCNVQDGVVIHALKEKWVKVEGRKWAVYIGSDVSLAHQALVHGPCLIGAGSFIGFKAIVHDSIVGQRCFIGMGAVVVGVEIPSGKRVPNGWVVDSADKVKELPDVSDEHMHFNQDVVEVNRGLAAAYARHEEMDPVETPSSSIARQLKTKIYF